MEKIPAEIIFGAGMSQRKLAALIKLKQHRNNFKLLCFCLASLPAEIRKLFLRVESVAYIPKNRCDYDGSSLIPLFSSSSIRVYPLAFSYPRKKGISVKDYVWKLLVHELAHVWDFTERGLGFIPDEFYAGITEAEWKEALAAEPESPEYFPDCSKSLQRYNRKPEEQWAIRMALTIVCDYLAPAGLVSADNIGRTPRTLSAAEFKEKWPKSYHFFHNYLKNILWRID